MFTEKDKGSFKYWFAHWCAFNRTALKLGCWKFKYLFHDIEKPFLNLFLPYKKVKEWHRNHSKHHIESYYYILKRQFNDMDWQAMVIDWECSRFTKKNAQLNARETLQKVCKEYETIDDIMVKVLKRRIGYYLNKFGL